MSLPFTLSQFLEVFSQYNFAVWPMQVVIYILGISTVFLPIIEKELCQKIISGILASIWLWAGVVYNLIYFSEINKAAYIFGALFIIQAILFLLTGVFKSHLSFRAILSKSNIYTNTGSFFILYALIIHFVIGYFFGQTYPKSQTLGLPSPTTIFTVGLLLWTDKKIPRYLLVIPFIWSIIGLFIAVSLGFTEDIVIYVASLIGILMILRR